VSSATPLNTVPDRRMQDDNLTAQQMGQLGGENARKLTYSRIFAPCVADCTDIVWDQSLLHMQKSGVKSEEVVYILKMYVICEQYLIFVYRNIEEIYNILGIIMTTFDASSTGKEVVAKLGGKLDGKTSLSTSLPTIS
jgi:hypothetical protein